MKILIPIITVLIFVLSTAIFLILQKPTPALQSKCLGGYLKLTPAEIKILEGADERIEKYRMGTAHISIVTETGRPVTNAKIKIKQTEHEFLFGANNDIGIWMEIADKKLGFPAKTPGLSEKRLDIYLKKFNDFANYQNIPGSWNYYEPIDDKFNYKLYDKAFDWVEQDKIRAGTSVWNSLYFPNWVPKNCDELEIELEERLRSFISHYQGRYSHLYVLNELANPYRKIFAEVPMTECIRKTGKIEWGKKWLNIAREEDPNAKLQINEVSILPEKGFPDLLDGLRDDAGNLLFDTIGIQSHMHNKVWDIDGVWKVCEGYSAFEVPIHFTEVSVLSGTPMSGKFGKVSTRKGECKQAEYAVNFYTILFSHPNVEAIMWWNFSDFKAWKNAPAGLLRKDMSSKSAYSALMELIYNKWWTTAETTTSEQGQAKFSGYFGKYNITITTDSGESQTFDIELNKKGKRNFQIALQN